MPRRPVDTALSHARVIAAAVAAADSGGLPAVTMRGIALALECEAMSLYHYVSGKDALLDGMVDAVTGEIAAAYAAVADGDDWRVTVRRRCLLARSIMLDHPWAPGLVVARRQPPEALAVVYELLLTTLYGAGFSDGLAHRAVHVMGSGVLGFSNELFDLGAAQEMPDAAALAALDKRLPATARLARSVVHEATGSLGGCDTQAEWEFTLDLILDGLEARHASA